MKTRLPSLLLPAALVVALSPIAAADVILSDHFDQYATGVASFSSKWTTAMSGDSTKFWSSGGAPTNVNNGPQTSREITVAPDRTGNAFHYTESSSTANFPYIYHDLAAPHTTGSWQMSIDFRIDSVSNTNTFWLGAIYGATGRSTSSLIAHANVRTVTGEEGSSLELRLAYRTAASGGGDSVFETLTISADTWYTLVITGNHDTQTLTYSVAGLGSISGYYQNNFDQLATVLLGDAQGSYTAPSSSVYLDNFELRAIPEASTTAFLLSGAALVGYGIRGYRNRSRLLP